MIHPCEEPRPAAARKETEPATGTEASPIEAVTPAPLARPDFGINAEFGVRLNRLMLVC